MKSLVERIYCDALGCTASKDTVVNGNESFFFCRHCRLSYLCRYHLKRKRGIKSLYLCPVCNSTLVEIPIYRAREMGLTDKIVPRISRGTTFKNVWKEIQEKSDLQSIIKKWDIIYDYDKGDLSLVETIEKEIDDLVKIKSLTVPKIFSLLSKTDLEISEIDMNTGDLRVALKEIARDYPVIISIMHEALVKNTVNDLFAKTLVLIANDQLFDSSFITPDVNKELLGTIDLYSISNDTGKVSWFVISDDPISEVNYGSIITQVLSINPISFANLERLYIVSDQFTWTVRRIAERQPFITTSKAKARIKLVRIDKDGTITVL